MIKLFNNDCVKIIKNLNNDSIDLTITSPPYDNLRDYNGYALNIDVLISELYRITKDGGIVVWIVKDQTIKGSESLSSFKHAIRFVEVGFRLHDTMIYLKENPVPVGGSNRYYDAFEYMFVFSKGKPKTFNPIQVPRRNKHNDKRTSRIRAVQRNKDGSFTKKKVNINCIVKKNNVWSYTIGGGNSTKDKEAYRHPAIFPEQLVLDHMLSWSNEEDLVFDPMMGSGTTGKIAILNNRSFIGIEISEEYFNLAKKRLEQVKEK